MPSPAFIAAICPSACTPVSVREEPSTVTGWLTIDPAAFSTSRCTVGVGVQLPLPTVVGRAVVGDGEFVAFQPIFLAPLNCIEFFVRLWHLLLSNPQ